MSDKLEAPLRSIVRTWCVDGGSAAGGGWWQAEIDCGHTVNLIGRPSSGSDRKRCDRCAPVSRVQAARTFIATDALAVDASCASATYSIHDDSIAASAPQELSSTAEPQPTPAVPYHAPAVVRAAGSHGDPVDQAFARAVEAPAVLTLETPTVAQRAPKAGRR